MGGCPHLFLANNFSKLQEFLVNNLSDLQQVRVAMCSAVPPNSLTRGLTFSPTPPRTHTHTHISV